MPLPNSHPPLSGRERLNSNARARLSTVSFISIAFKRSSGRTGLSEQSLLNTLLWLHIYLYTLIKTLSKTGFLSIFFIESFRHIFHRFFATRLNTFMTNRQFLQSIYDTVKALGIVKSQYEFGYLCGKEQSWFSCAKSVDRRMSIAAMVSLAVSLQNLPPERISKSARPHVKRLIAEIWRMIEAQGAKKAA